MHETFGSKALTCSPEMAHCRYSQSAELCPTCASWSPGTLANSPQRVSSIDLFELSFSTMDRLVCSVAFFKVRVAKSPTDSRMPKISSSVLALMLSISSMRLNCTAGRTQLDTLTDFKTARRKLTLHATANSSMVHSTQRLLDGAYRSYMSSIVCKQSPEQSISI